MPGAVRIIGGVWRRQRVAVPDVAGLRPSGDRVRETLFNWLAPRIEGARCADLYAGSGVLGFEAASRGAAAVALIEADPRSARSLTSEYARLQMLAPVQAEVQIRCTDALGWLRAFDSARLAPLDIVFLDPPFGSTLLRQSLSLLVSAAVLSANARVYIETSAHDALDLPEGLAPVRSERAGQVRYHLAAFEG